MEDFTANNSNTAINIKNNKGDFIFVIDPEKFINIGTFKQNLTYLCHEITQQNGYIPGNNCSCNRKNGVIQIKESLYKTLQK